MKSNINETPLRTYTDTQFPTVWTDENGIKIHGYQNRTDLHYGHGFREYVAPVIDSSTHKVGALYFDTPNDVVKSHVIALTEEELKARTLSEAEGQREAALQEKARKAAEESFQAIEDDSEALDNQAAYPLWISFEDGFAFPIDFKVQDFEGLELKLFKVLQAHNKQSDWAPVNVPALFVKVLLPGAAKIWEAGLQVLVGEEYEYQGSTYIVLQAHTTLAGWEPPNVPALWQLKP